MQQNEKIIEHPAKERVYVAVNSEIDATGYLQPREIIWKDGRVFPIEKITSFRPAAEYDSHMSGDCYIVSVRGEKKFLFFERTDPMFRSRIGRWFIEVNASDEYSA